MSSSNNNNKGGSGFGRDEMNLLLGSVGGDADKAGLGTAGAALLHGSSDANNKGSGKKKGDEVDIATLSTAQTAALLHQQQQAKGLAPKTGRHRAQRGSTKKRLQHHELLEQELIAQQQQQLQKPTSKAQQHQESSDEDQGDFAAGRHKRKTNPKRIQLEPQIVTQKDAHKRRRRQRSSSSSEGEQKVVATKRRRRRQDDSSSSSSDSDTKRKDQSSRKRSNSSSSSSSSEDEARQRRLKKRQQLQAETSSTTAAKSRKQQEPEIVSSKKPKPSLMKEEKENVLGDSSSKANLKSVRDKPESSAARPQRKRRRQGESSSSSSGSSSSNDSSSSEDSSSSSDDDGTPAMAKPLFVPKQKRLQLAQEKAEAEEAATEQAHNAKHKETKRKMESRALVAQVVSASTTPAAQNEDAASEDEEALAVRMLDDMDDKDEDLERDGWEVRELERLLEEIDRLRQKELSQAEYRRRQQLTDEEARAEDIASGRYQQPGSNRMTQGAGDKDGPKYQQKFFHRGAFYMDEDEFDEDDVRHKAKEYAQGVTESQKSLGDTRKLPKIMQAKGFGRANQSRYQGLASEDTSRKDSSTLLPLVHHKQSHQLKATDIPTTKKKSG